MYENVSFKLVIMSGSGGIGDREGVNGCVRIIGDSVVGKIGWVRLVGWLVSDSGVSGLERSVGVSK